jgi:FMN phosphatase YigB (HAD superfamily)
VATSARDVRGAVEAGIDVIRLRRPGHEPDPAAPAPARDVPDLAALRQLLEGS